MTSKVREVETELGKPVAEILREMYEQGMSQRVIAAKLGVSQSTVSLWSVKAGLKLIVQRNVEPICDPCKD